MPKSQFSPRYKTFCGMLREARLKAGLSQQEVAGRLGKPQSWVSKYESGERRLDVVEFLEIAEVVGFSAEGFLRKLLKA